MSQPMKLCSQSYPWKWPGEIPVNFCVFLTNCRLLVNTYFCRLFRFNTFCNFFNSPCLGQGSAAVSPLYAGTQGWQTFSSHCFFFNTASIQSGRNIFATIFGTLRREAPKTRSTLAIYAHQTLTERKINAMRPYKATLAQLLSAKTRDVACLFVAWKPSLACRFYEQIKCKRHTPAWHQTASEQVTDPHDVFEAATMRTLFAVWQVWLLHMGAAAIKKSCGKEMKGNRIPKIVVKQAWANASNCGFTFAFLQRSPSRKRTWLGAKAAKKTTTTT